MVERHEPADAERALLEPLMLAEPVQERITAGRSTPIPRKVRTGAGAVGLAGALRQLEIDQRLHTPIRQDLLAIT